MTNAELAILSLIAEQARHGYEIEHIIEERGMRDWTEIGFSSIYYLLKKLEKNGLVEVHLTEAARGAARKVYHITETGMEVWRTALIEALADAQPRYSPLIFGIGNLPALPQADVLAALKRHQDALIQRLVIIQARQEAQQPLPYFVDAMFDYSITMIQTEQNWIEKFIKQMEDNNG
jgi:DNA-binding PadR family transcriptional regulator